MFRLTKIYFRSLFPRPSTAQKGDIFALLTILATNTSDISYFVPLFSEAAEIYKTGHKQLIVYALPAVP